VGWNSNDGICLTRMSLGWLVHSTIELVPRYYYGVIFDEHKNSIKAFEEGNPSLKGGFVLVDSNEVLREGKEGGSNEYDVVVRV